MNIQRLNSLNLSRLFPEKGASGKGGFLAIFLFLGFLFLPVLCSAQQQNPTLTYGEMRRLKFTAGDQIPVKKQVIPYRAKVAVHFPELGELYNPNFPETRTQIYVANFFNQHGNGVIKGPFSYIGKSISTNRATVFIQKEGTHYGTWNDGKCVSLIEYKVTRVGENLEITGMVYVCFVTS